MQRPPAFGRAGACLRTALRRLPTAAMAAALLGGAAAASGAPRPSPAANDAATAAALGELGLKLLRADRPASAASPVGNSVVSSLSLAQALGLLQAGTAGASAHELNRLMGDGRVSAGQRLYQQRLPDLAERLARDEGLHQANRLWLDDSLVKALQPSYAQRVQARQGTPAGVIPAFDAELARSQINRWVGEQTQQRIAELLPEGSLQGSTRLVLTNALHFKRAWAQPFPVTGTQLRPFTGDDGAVVQARQMQDEREVLQASVQGVTVMELPFATQEGRDAPAYSLLLALPPAGQRLGDFVQTLHGTDLARWRGALQPKRCQLSLPRLDLAPRSRPLKDTLQALGLKTPFSDRADFSPLLRQGHRGLRLENVFQSAAIALDETGAEASAATAAVVGLKSFAPVSDAPACAADRPFFFAVMHRASGVPLFMGQLAEPLRN
ncbi:serpin family protein [Ideonella livida]|uniref:Serpin family protein n=1 Tax=Ideonella livida TaxID=2707176 RepID=A0A7C9PIJ1_9BURK|nr:serpin family protein [Ideonella livida]NDY92569.1 serpin family protein [Ideonella livida]